ncbi:hypothetical protein K4L44_11335 [Halosquirtibacter laminarini]|uniref:Uncharacterized protein n=1 Tax=Halosquirtibacter laminarini TaxID=3374600 RepID=A0AC61NCF7_9BACT|nr:hypothetical protein K4L44_11335 [Prolixibacteraceae bacterium]
MGYQEQRICVWFESEQAPLTQIKHGVLLAEIMKKELCFYHISTNKSTHSNIEKAMEVESNKIVERDPIQRITIEVKEGVFHKNLIDTIEELDLLLFIFDKKRDHKKLKTLGDTTIPYLFTDEKVNFKKIFTDIVFPIGYVKRSKDSALWASYIARYNHTNVTILQANDKDKDDKQLIETHLYSIENLFDKFQFQHQIENLGASSWRMNRNTFRSAEKHDAGLIIMALSLDNHFITKFIPGYHESYIKRSKHMPILLINSTRDLYTMCGG